MSNTKVRLFFSLVIGLCSILLSTVESTLKYSSVIGIDAIHYTVKKVEGYSNKKKYTVIECLVNNCLACLSGMSYFIVIHNSSLSLTLDMNLSKILF